MASASNSTFPWSEGLAAARALVALASEVDAADAALVDATADARIEFSGPVRRSFDLRRGDERASATRIAGGLQDLADAIARDWARERGNQDRTNFGRWRDAQIAHDNWMENLYEWFVGEDDYGPPPGDPPTPRGPGYAPTRAPLYSAYGP